MNRLSKVTSKGQVTIPSEIRDDLTLMPGDYIYFESVNGSAGTITVRAVSRMKPQDLRGALSSGKPYEDIATVREKAARTHFKDEEGL